MSLSGVDLNLMVAFDVLLTERNVTRAAQRASISQPAMSAALARLRKHFGDELLVKDGRRLVLTPLAESLVDPVREAVRAAETVMHATKSFDPATEHRTFTILASDYVTLILLRPMLGSLARDAPNIRISIVPLQENFTEQLGRGSVDLLIMPIAFVDNHAFPHQRLYTDRYLLACDRDNPAVHTTITPGRLSQQPYLSYSIGPVLNLAESELEEHGIHRRVEVRTQSFLIAPFLITGTPLVTMVHERLARQLAEPANIRLLDPPIPISPVVEAMYWSPRHTDDPAHCWLRSRISQLADTL